jgi:hypothetical protein
MIKEVLNSASLFSQTTLESLDQVSINYSHDRVKMKSDSQCYRLNLK